jgi:hypothetical protein
MKLNFRLDLNTIVLLLLIVVFSVILYYNFKRSRIVEGNTSVFDSKKTEYADTTTKIKLYEDNQTLYASTWSVYTTNKNILSRVRGDYDPLVSKIAINNSSSITNLFPNTNDIKYNIEYLKDLLETKISEINAIQSKYADITDFIPISGISTQANFNSNNTKITNKINELKEMLGRLKTEIIAMLGFTIGPIVAGDKEVTLTINTSPSATANTYTINATYPENKNIQKILPTNFTNPYVLTDPNLINDVPYTFSVTADYGVLSDGTKLSNTTTSATAITPRAKPSFTVTMGTGSASVNIVTTTGTPPPIYTITVTPSIGQTKTYPVTTANNTSIANLENGVKHDFKVIADYGNGATSESDVKTGIPRAQPTLSASGSDGAATLTIGEPDVADKPMSYTINATPSGVPENTVSDISNPVRFKGLANGITYTFSVVAIYNDGTKSSPVTAQVTPKARPLAGITATAGNTTARITIIPPPSTLPSEIKNYYVTSVPQSTPATIGANDNKSFTMIGLTNGTLYTFNVVVNYTDGTKSSPVTTQVTPDGPPSPPPTDVTTPKTATLPPTFTVTATKGNKKATLRISQTSRPLISPSKYEISYTQSKTPIIVDKPPALSYSRDITGLSKGSSYTFKVTISYSGEKMVVNSNRVTLT